MANNSGVTLRRHALTGEMYVRPAGSISGVCEHVVSLSEGECGLPAAGTVGVIDPITGDQHKFRWCVRHNGHLHHALAQAKFTFVPDKRRIPRQGRPLAVAS